MTKWMVSTINIKFTINYGARVGLVKSRIVRRVNLSCLTITKRTCDVKLALRGRFCLNTASWLASPQTHESAVRLGEMFWIWPLASHWECRSPPFPPSLTCQLVVEVGRKSPQAKLTMFEDLSTTSRGFSNSRLLWLPRVNPYFSLTSPQLSFTLI